METTSATAQLVGTRDMLAAFPNAVTTTIARGDIEEALSSDLPTELFLDVLRPAHAGVEAETRTVTVMWDRADLASLLEDNDADAMTFSFDGDELERAFDDPEFEGHGLRETAMIITVAAAAAIGASAASGMPMQDGGGPSSLASVTAVSAGHDEAGLASRGIESQALAASHDEAGLAARGIAAEAVAASHDEAGLASRGIETPALVVGDSGSGWALPTLDANTAAALGAGLAGATLLIATAMFAAGRNRMRLL